MSKCREIGRWIEENIEQPVERFFQRAEQVCEDVGRWVREEVLEPVETWVNQQEQRCREEKCVWICFCCNKLFCWLVTILVKVIEWIIRVVFVWLVETICKIIVTIIRVIVMLIITILKWVVIAIVCIFEALCQALIVFAALAILFALLALASIPIPLLAATSLPLVVPALVSAAIALGLIRLLCEVSWCRFWGIVGWAFMWATLLTGAMALFYLSIGTGLFMAIYGGTVAAIIIALERIGCSLPKLIAWP